MRKCNQSMVRRGGGRTSEDEDGTVKYDRSNFPQQWGHSMVNSKGFQYAAMHLMQRMLSPFIPKRKPGVEV